MEEVERSHVYLALGTTSLFHYCVELLKLTESQACAMIAVMRKAKVIPALKQALDKGEMNVSRAKRIVSVMTEANAKSWIEKAQTLKQRELEKELVKEHPKKALPERVVPLSSQRFEFRFTASSQLEEKLNRVKEILKTTSLEETLEKLTSLFLKRNDPAEKKVPSLRNVPRPFQRNIPKSIKNRVLSRDKGQCTYLDESGNRCGSRKWVNVHHVQHFAKGGNHSLQNLATLCYGHHKLVHFDEDEKSRPELCKQSSGESR